MCPAADPEDNFSILHKEKQRSLRARARGCIDPFVKPNGSMLVTTFSKRVGECSL